MPGDTRRIARNTLALYLRTGIVLIINLYASRVVLATLGVDDYAIYNLVGQFILAFTVISSTLTIASQRYITFELGRSEGNVSDVFSTSLNIHLIASVVIVLASEAVGIWYLYHRLNIPADRVAAAMWMLQCSLVTLLLQFVSIPYTSVIIAFERIDAFAYIAIAEALLKLAAVLLLPRVGGDSLIVYALMTAAIAVIIRVTYGVYCRRAFPTVRYRRVIVWDTFRSMSRFMGWNILGNTADVASHQFVALLINRYFALAVSTARGIAGQVENAVLMMVRNIPIAINPQITKSYAAGDYDQMTGLVVRGAKFCFFLFLLPAIPLLLQTDHVLHLWLVQYPAHTVAFVRLTLVNCMVLSVGFTTDTAIFATGRIMAFQLTTGLLQLLVYPLSWYAFSIGMAPETCYVAAVVCYTLTVAAKVVIAHQKVGHDFLPRFVRQVVVRITAVLALSVAVAYGACLVLHGVLPWLGELVAVTLVSLAATAAFTYGVGMTSDERLFARRRLARLIPSRS